MMRARGVVVSIIGVPARRELIEPAMPSQADLVSECRALEIIARPNRSITSSTSLIRGTSLKRP